MILLIDNYDSFTYNLYQQISRIHPHCVVIRNDKVDIEMIETMAPKALILSPGPGNPTNAGNCLTIIQHFAPRLPLFGICLGHQAILQAFGGTVSHAPSIVHGKSCQVHHQHKGLFKQLPQPFAAGRYHSLHVAKADVPDCFEIDATSDDGVVMAVSHKSLPVYGVQFHPESILTPVGDQLMQRFCNSLEVKCD